MSVKKSYTKWILLFLLLTTLIAIVMPTVSNAESVKCSCGATHSISGIKYTDYCVSTAVYSGNLFTKVDAADMDINDILAFDTSDGTFKTLWEWCGKVYEGMIPVGLLLAVIYFLLGLGEKVLDDNFTAEVFAREFIKLAAMVLLVQNGWTLVDWGIQLSTFIFKKLSDATTLISSGGSCQYNACNNRDILESIGNIISLYFPYLGIQLAQFIVKIIAWSRVLNLVVRVMLAPIGMADCIRGGTSSQGFKYFKKIVSVSLQGAIILSVSVAYDLIKSIIVVNSDFSWLITLVLAATCVTLIFRTSQMADEVMGV